MCLLDLFCGMGEEGESLKWHLPVWRLFDHRKKNFFIKLALKPQIRKEGDQGLLKLHVHLGRFQYEGKIGLSPKKNFV